MTTATLRTACTRDCPDACGLIVTVEDGRVTRLSGERDHPVTRGFLCYRVGTHYVARQNSTERITTPLVRDGDGFRAITWGEAIDVASHWIDRIRRESGAAALLHVQGGGSLGILKNLNKLFARSLGATETRGDVCDAAGAWANDADFGSADQNDVADLVNARGVILWGKNVTASSPHSTPFLTEARKAGAELILIDPLPHRSRKLVDRYVQTRPGGDGALALGVARVVLDEGWEDPDVARYSDDLDAYRALVRSRSVAAWADEADVPTATVVELARFFVECAPVTTLVGWGMQRRVNGASQVRAINALHALSGNVGKSGAGASFTTPRRRPFDLDAITALAGRVPRTVPIALLGRAIEEAVDPPIRGVLIDNGNPVATNAESETTRRALLSREFVMVIDNFLTDTARSASLVLPTTTMLEERDLVGSYGHHYVSATVPVVARPDGARSDLEIYQALADRLGFGPALAGTPDQWIERFTTRIRAGGLTIDQLDAGAHRDPHAPRVAFEGRRFATATGRFRFLADYPTLPPRDAEYPLYLQALSTGRWQASQLTDQDEEREGPLAVHVHPDTALGLADGAEAILESKIAAIPVVVRHEPEYRRDTVYVPRARSVAKGLCVNLLIRARLTDHGDGCAYYDEGVRLRRSNERTAEDA